MAETEAPPSSSMAALTSSPAQDTLTDKGKWTPTLYNPNIDKFFKDEKRIPAFDQEDYWGMSYSQLHEQPFPGVTLPVTKNESGGIMCTTCVNSSGIDAVIVFGRALLAYGGRVISGEGWTENADEPTATKEKAQNLFQILLWLDFGQDVDFDRYVKGVVYCTIVEAEELKMEIGEKLTATTFLNVMLRLRTFYSVDFDLTYKTVVIENGAPSIKWLDQKDLMGFNDWHNYLFKPPSELGAYLNKLFAEQKDGSFRICQFPRFLRIRIVIDMATNDNPPWNFVLTARGHNPNDEKIRKHSHLYKLIAVLRKSNKELGHEDSCIIFDPSGYKIPSRLHTTEWDLKTCPSNTELLVCYVRVDSAPWGQDMGINDTELDKRFVGSTDWVFPEGHSLEEQSKKMKLHRFLEKKPVQQTSTSSLSNTLPSSNSSQPNEHELSKPPRHLRHQRQLQQDNPVFSNERRRTTEPRDLDQVSQDDSRHSNFQSFSRNRYQNSLDRGRPFQHQNERGDNSASRRGLGRRGRGDGPRSYDSYKPDYNDNDFDRRR